MGRLIEKKKELTADAALVESINLLFLCGWVMGRSAANGSAQRRKQRRLIGDPAFLSLFHQLCWLRREMRWLVWIAALLSSSSLWGYGAGHRPMLRKERENEDKKRAARQNQQLRRKRKVAQRLQANQQQTFLLHEEKSEVVDGVACCRKRFIWAALSLGQVKWGQQPMSFFNLIKERKQQPNFMNEIGGACSASQREDERTNHLLLPPGPNPPLQKEWIEEYN